VTVPGSLDARGLKELPSDSTSMNVLLYRSLYPQMSELLSLILSTSPIREDILLQVGTNPWDVNVC